MAVTAGHEANPTRNLDATDFVRIRASTDESKSTVVEWQGQVLSYLPGERPQVTFKVKGMSVTRARKLENGSYDLMTREIQLYLDPLTEEVLHVWHNPWSDQKVIGITLIISVELAFTSMLVVHVANNPVYQNLPATSTFEARAQPGGSYTCRITIPLAYPNPLNSAADQGPPKYHYAGPQALYSAIESFSFSFPAAELDSSVQSIPSMQVFWTRTSPLLPFMATPATNVMLLTVANGAKVEGGWEKLDPVLRNMIETKLPAYKDAPTTRDRPGGGVSSWSYFARPEVLQAYKEGATFPLPDHPVDP
ncbi:hypothetical protein C0993_009815 [Termitomyces sp. T159_Od127]|nr:hypothetical protein C0993_009815 [Termitomyces sp. T159_Od127]